MKCYKCETKITSKNYVFTLGKKCICKKCFEKMVHKHGELAALRKLAKK